MAETSSNIAQKIIREIRALLDPLVDIFGDDEVRREVLLSLGMHIAPMAPVPNLQNPGSGLDSIDAYIQQSDPDMVAFASALADIAQLGVALESFIQLVASDPANADIAAQEALNMFVSALSVGYIRSRQPETYAFMRAVGLISEQGFHLDRIGKALGVGSIGFGDLITEADAVRYSDTLLFPTALVTGIIAVKFDLEFLQAVYGWEASPGSTSPNADIISERMLYIGGDFKGKTAEGSAGAKIGTTWALVPQDHQGIALLLGLSADGKVELKLGSDWKLELDGGGLDFVLRLGAGSGITGPADSQLKFKISRDTEGKPEQRWLLGSPTGTRLDIGAAEVSGLLSEKDIGIEAALKSTRLYFKVDSPIFPGGEWSAQFDFGLGYSRKRHFYLGSGSSLTVDLPISVTIGSKLTGLTIQYITLGLKALETPKSGVELETSLSANFTLFGVFKAVVQRIGVLTELNFPKDDGKDLDIDLRFKPPMGIGLELDLGFMVGGGFIFLDPDNGFYAGILHFEFRALKIGSLTAVGLLNTKLPDGTEIVSLMLIISVKFPFPYVQLTFGFTLNGVGLILGVNRTADTARLTSGVRDHTLESILFPVDPINNAIRVINDVKQVFPPERDRTIFGGMIELGWGGIITLDVGLLIEFNESWEPARFVIIGVLKINVPTPEAAIISINAAIAGVFDSDGVRIAGSLFDSRIAFFNISGDMYLLARGGGNAVFLFSIGGFHPAFQPPSDVPALRRLTIGMSVGDVFRYTVEYYFAITSNTLQFGAKAELFVGVDAFNVYGFIGFDALFQFDPFQFRVDFHAGLAVRSGTTAILSIELSGVFSGPNPWFIQGKGRFKILFFSFSVDVSFTIGDKQDEQKLSENVQARLTAELNKDENWQARQPDERSAMVALRSESIPGVLLVNPFGTLQVSQKLVPLGVKLDRFYNASVEGADLLDVTALRTSGEDMASERAEEQFARAQFQEMSGADKLSSPSFENLKSGLRANATALLKVTQALTRVVTYEDSIIDAEGQRCWIHLTPLYIADLEFAQASSPAALSPLATHLREQSPLAPPKVNLKQDTYAVVRADSLQPAGAEFIQLSYSEASTHLSRLAEQSPSAASEFIVVPTYEAQV
jgi:Family of unknown function (DUF6603)